MNRSFDTFQYTITLGALSALLWTFSPWILALVVAAGLPLFIGELWFSSRSFRFYTGRTPEMRERNNLESLMVSDGPAMERIHSQSSEALRGRYAHLFVWLFGQDRAMHFRHTMIGLGLIGASSLVFISGQLWVAWTALLGAITLGQMTMFAALLRQGQSAVTGLFTTLNTSFEDLLYMAKLFDLLGLEEGRPRGSATAGPKPDDGYRLEDVSFSYPNGRRPALQDVTLHISHGIRLGIVGANGSGKTTLVKLLIGLYLPSSGRITLDGLDLADWDAAALYSRTAAMFQPFQRYNMTVADNIAIGDGFRTDDPDKVMDAAKRGFSDELVQELPDGLETKLSRQFLDGRELSGGQWQRLALSRAMIRTGAETLILDEPTAALDPEAEALLISELEDPGHTTILISHRLSNLRHADRIIVLDKGRIVQDGTHDDLLDEDGLYRSMFEKKASFYR